jgi:hypothetical protein
MSTANTPGVVNIAYVVASMLNELGEYHDRQRKRYTQFVIDCLQNELNMYHRSSIEVAYLTPNAANVCELPQDFIDYTKIGIASCGKLWTLTLNEDLITPTREKCGLPISEVCTGDSEIDWGYQFAPHYNRGQFVGALFGMGGGFNYAYYKVDKNRRQIILDGAVPNGEIVLEYKSSGITGPQTVVPREAVPVLRAYAHWKRVEFDPQSPANDKDRKFRLYDIEVEKFRHLENSFTIDELRDALNSTYSQNVKR